MHIALLGDATTTTDPKSPSSPVGTRQALVPGLRGMCLKL